MSTTDPLPGRTAVLVVGSGFAGIATAVRLRRAGRTDVVVLERASDVGGTWRDNDYPGCACDVPSHLYSLSFAPNPDWTRSFSSQPEIRAYLQRVAREHGVLPHVRFGTEMLDARWDAADQCWRVETNRGRLTAGVLVLATGGLSEPTVPSLPGLHTFTGTTFHSARWDHDHRFEGERVAVVGTGASAVQFVPHVAARAAHTTVFQRTAPWVMPRADAPIRPAVRALYRRVPAAMRLRRAGIYALRESWLLAFTGHEALMRRGEQVARAHLAAAVRDPELRRKLTPTYRMGCKRVLLSNDYYPALAREDVDVVTDRIVEVLPRAVLTEGPAGRVEHPVDTIVFGTGFRVTDHPVTRRVRDAEGRSLAEHWADTGMAALRGTTIAGFPNLFFLTGPNTGLGHTSILYVVESQVTYLLDALRLMDERGLGALAPRQEAQDAYNAEVQRRLQRTVWNTGGCSSWYLDASGRNTVLWPTYTLPFRRRTRHVDLGEYVVEPRRAPVEVAA